MSASRLSEILERRAKAFPVDAITAKIRVAIDVHEYEGEAQAAGLRAREIYEDYIQPLLDDIDWLLDENARLRGQRDTLLAAIQKHLSDPESFALIEAALAAAKESHEAE